MDVRDDARLVVAVTPASGPESIPEVVLAGTRDGLEWLAAGGHVSMEREDGSVLLSPGNSESNQYLQRELYIAVKGILQETAAYRTHFQRADAQSLMEWE